MSTLSPAKRRDALTAFALLATIVAGHTVLETARDALFLARIPAVKLPWMYLIVAGSALIVMQLRIPLAERFTRRKLLALGLALSGAVTGAFWLLASSGVGVLYALYLWAALFASLVLVTFWLALDEDYTVTEAKQIYGFIGAGSTIGAAVGAAFARGLVVMYSPRDLLVAAAAFFFAAALLMGLWGPGEANPPAQSAETIAWRALRQIEVAPYLRRLALLTLVLSIAATLVDYLFKSWVSQSLPTERLATVFATTSFVQSVLGLTVQLLGVGWLLRTAGVTRALLVLPLVFLFGGIGLAAAGGLALALAMKIADATLRFSVQRTGGELLFLPVDEAVRRRVKPLIDVVGQRIGQSLAAIAVLAVGAVTSAQRILAVALALLAAVWGWLVIGLQSGYLELFRQILRRGRLPALTEVPRLDLSALETLIQALNSSDDGEVLAALELLVAYQRTRLIPALILFHPSREVVLRALDYFSAAQRGDVVSALERLRRHPDAEIRAAALWARAAQIPDQTYLRAALADESAIVRATALVGLTAKGWLTADESSKRLADLLEQPNEQVHLALAEAIRRQPHPRFETILLMLGKLDSTLIRLEVARAIQQLPSPSFLPLLVGMLAESSIRAAARDALLAIGGPALEYLERAMDDFSVPREARRAIPGTLALFSPEEAAPRLLSHLCCAKEGVVRYRILRSLRRLQEREPHLPLDHQILRQGTQETITIAFRNLHWRLTLERHKRSDRFLPGEELLRAVLRDKEALATDRAFRLLHLQHPLEDFERISRGFKSQDRVLRSSSQELLESVLQPPERQALLALVADSDSGDRVQAGLPYYAPRPLSLEEVLDELLAARSTTLQCLAAYHAAELGLQQFHSKLDALRLTAPPELAEVVEGALAVLSKNHGPEVAHAE